MRYTVQQYLDANAAYRRHFGYPVKDWTARALTREQLMEAITTAIQTNQPLDPLEDLPLPPGVG
jgi:hypothetical protein